MYIKERLLFVRNFIKNFSCTGAFFPSSSYLAEELVLSLKEVRPAYNILEAGSGTGAVTKHILKHMKEQDKLIICELNPDLCKLLKESLQANPDYQKHKDRVQIFEGGVQDVDATEKFDSIICSLPFLNFPADLTEEIFSKFYDFTNDQAKLSYFSYSGLKNIGALILGKQRRLIKQFLDNQKYFQRISANTVWKNIVPATVVHLSRA